MSEAADDILNVRIDRKIIEKVATADAEAIENLTKLDIHPVDQSRIGKILDSHHTGHVTVEQLLQGLQRFRGIPRRSDILSAEFVSIAVVEKVDEIGHRLKHFPAGLQVT